MTVLRARWRAPSPDAVRHCAGAEAARVRAAVVLEEQPDWERRLDAALAELDRGEGACFLDGAGLLTGLA